MLLGQRSREELEEDVVLERESAAESLRRKRALAFSRKGMVRWVGDGVVLIRRFESGYLGLSHLI